MKTVMFAAVMTTLFLSTGARAASVNLAWDPVTTNADGTPITDLGGYRLFHHTSSLLGMTTAQAMANASVIKTSIPGSGTTFNVGSLAASTTYYFRLTAYDTSNNQSGFNVDSAGNNVQVSARTPSTNVYDVNGDGVVNVTDVQITVNQALGLATCGTGNVNGDGACNVTDVQLVVNRALGL